MVNLTDSTPRDACCLTECPISPRSPSQVLDLDLKRTVASIGYRTRQACSVVWPQTVTAWINALPRRTILSLLDVFLYTGFRVS